MHRVVRLYLILALSLVVPLSDATAVNAVISHQGRLLDGSDTPINGSVAMIFRLYDDPVSGTLIWSESHPAVSVANGLFSVTLGDITPLSADNLASPPSSGLPPSERFLEIEVAGETMTPRTRLVSDPFAIITHRVDGDIHTGPGEISMNGTSETTGNLSAGGSQGTGYYFGHSQGSNVGLGSLRIGPDSALSRIGADLNGDGLPDVIVSSFATPDSSGIATEGYDEPAGTGLRERGVGRITFKAKEGASLTGRVLSELLYDSDDDGVSDVEDSRVVSRSGAKSKLVWSPQSNLTVTEAEFSVDSSMSSASNRMDLDDDGVPEQEVSSSVVPTKSQHAINTKGTGAQNGRVVAIQSETTVDSASQSIFVDDDGDGNKEAKVTAVAFPQAGVEPLQVRMACTVDSDDDGNPETSASTTVTADSVIDALDMDSDDDGIVDRKLYPAVKDVNGDGHADVQIMMLVDSDNDGNPETSAQTMVMADSIVDYRDLDSDDDGVADAFKKETYSFNNAPSGVQIEITASRVVRGSSGTFLDEATGNNLLNREIRVADLDSDGFPELAVSSYVTPDSGRISVESYDNGTVHTEVGLETDRTASRLAIKTKGTSAHRNQITGVADDTSAVIVSESDSASIAIRTKGGGVIKGAININHANRSLIDMSVEDTATTISNALDLDGDGLADVAVINACTVDSAYESTTFSFPNSTSPTSESGWVIRSKKSKTYQEMHNAESASKTALELACDSSTASTVWSADDFSGLPATSLTIQASTDPLLNPIEHSSGAHLTPGGVWTNASDENLKENFQPVDGEELLEKIDDLPITRWNYRIEGDEVTHIGPTAQDFQKVFGVGSDGKTISTIDPAGIALAAIKALNEKSKRIDELESRIEELSRQLKELSEKK